MPGQDRLRNLPSSTQQCVFIDPASPSLATSTTNQDAPQPHKPKPSRHNLGHILDPACARAIRLVAPAPATSRHLGRRQHLLPTRHRPHAPNLLTRPASRRAGSIITVALTI
jgi:hypothetical protein